MLNSMATLMCRNGCRSDVTSGIDVFTEIDSLFCGIIVIRQLTLNLSHTDIKDSMVMQHLHSNITSCQSTRCRYLGVFLKLTSQICLCRIAGYGNYNKQSPIKVHNNSIFIFSDYFSLTIV